MKKGVSQIKIDVQDEKKLVCIWLTRAESAEADIRKSLKPLYGEYKSKKYFIALYRSGEQDLQEMTADRRNTIIRVNRAARTALEVFDDILRKEKLDRNDLQLIIEKIIVYEGDVDIRLKPVIDSLLHCGTLPEKTKTAAANFNSGTGDSLAVTIVQSAEKRPDKVFRANVISDGAPPGTTGRDWEYFCLAMYEIDNRLGFGLA